MRQTAIMISAALLLAACGSKAPPPVATPATSGLAAVPPAAAKPARGHSPWQNSRFFAPTKPAPAPLLSRPKRPIRGPAVHTLRS